MPHAYQHLEVHEQNGVFCVRIKSHRLLEDGIEQLNKEMVHLIETVGCRKLVLSLGPGDLECLYSLLLAKLVHLQRRIQKVGGTMAIAEASENTLGVFRATGLERFFKFYDDPPSAAEGLS